MFSYLFNYVNCAGCVKSFLQFFFFVISCIALFTFGVNFCVCE